jgi:hypothetical protein
MLHDGMRKSERINFVVTAAQKREIQATARSFRLTVTDYFLNLHRLAWAMSQGKKRTR